MSPKLMWPVGVKSTPHLVVCWCLFLVFKYYIYIKWGRSHATVIHSHNLITHRGFKSWMDRLFTRSKDWLPCAWYLKSIEILCGRHIRVECETEGVELFRNFKSLYFLQMSRNYVRKTLNASWTDKQLKNALEAIRLGMSKKKQQINMEFQGQH